MVWAPRVTVAAVIQRGDRYLLVEESDEAGRPVFNQPAGHLEPGESLPAAVCREVLEETGREFRPTGLVGVYRWPQPGTDRTYLRFCFTGEVSEPLPGRRLDPDIVATHWLDRFELSEGSRALRSPLVLRCLDDAANAVPAPLELLHEIP